MMSINKLLKYVLLSAVICSSASKSHSLDILTGVAKLSCENYLCTPSPVKPAECVPPIAAYRAACFNWNAAATCAPFIFACAAMRGHPLSDALLNPEWDITQCDAYDLLTRPNSINQDQDQPEAPKSRGGIPKGGNFKGYDYFLGTPFYTTTSSSNRGGIKDTFFLQVPTDCNRLADAVGDGFYTAESVIKDCSMFFYAPWDKERVPKEGKKRTKYYEDKEWHSKCFYDTRIITPSSTSAPTSWVEAHPDYKQASYTSSSLHLGGSNKVLVPNPKLIIRTTHWPDNGK